MKELRLLWCDFAQTWTFQKGRLRQITWDTQVQVSTGYLSNHAEEAAKSKEMRLAKLQKADKGGGGTGQPQCRSVRTPDSLETGRPVSQDRRSSNDCAWQCYPSTLSLFSSHPLLFPPTPVPTDDKRKFWTHQSDRMENSSEWLNAIHFLLESLPLYAIN